MEARDGGGLTSAYIVMVTVEDVNDNAPEFPLAVYSVTVSEGTAPVELIKLQVR